MTLTTKHFGEIDIDEAKIITFANGIPGFHQCTRFILLEETAKDGETGMFWWLQSTEEGDTAFVLMDVYQVMPQYNPLVDLEEIAHLGDYDPDFFEVYNIVVIPKNVTKATVNLKAPVVINTKTLQGTQVIVNNEDYGIRYEIYNEIKAKKAVI